MREKDICENTIRKHMKRYRIKFVIIEILLVVILVSYFIVSMPYILNQFQKPLPLDVDTFSEKSDMIAVEDITLHRNDSIDIPSYAVSAWSYWQGDRYEFEIPLTNVCKTDIFFVNKDTNTGSNSNKSEVSAIVYRANVGDKPVVLLAYPEQNLADSDVVEGIFTQIPPIIKQKMAESDYFADGEELSVYMLDIRGLEMESENFDTVFCGALLAISIWLAIKLVRQFKNHTRTPTFRQFERYGEFDEIEEAIENELKKGYRIEDKKVITENWIISKDVFKLKIVKNHIKHGSFQYVNIKN